MYGIQNCWGSHPYTCDLINVLHHFPYIVDFRSAVGLPYEHWSVANTDTRSAPIFWVASEFFLAITRVSESIFLIIINVTYSIISDPLLINKVSNKVPM